MLVEIYFTSGNSHRMSLDKAEAKKIIEMLMANPISMIHIYTGSTFFLCNGAHIDYIVAQQNEEQSHADYSQG